MPGTGFLFNEGVERIMKELTLFIPEAEIKGKVKRLAQLIKSEHENPVLICVLKGSIHFFSDLCREIGDCEIDFMKMTSYNGTIQGDVICDLLPSTDLFQREVVVVEDVIDGGRTMASILKTLKSVSPKKISICTLLFKPQSFRSDLYDFEPDYVGFNITNEFVVGYGFDHKQQYRNLKEIYCIK